MKLRLIVSVVSMTLALGGCVPFDEVKEPNEVKMSQAEIDMLVQNARAEERARISSELNKQEQQKRIYDEILIRQGKEPRFSDYYTQSQASSGSDPVEPIEEVAETDSKSDMVESENLTETSSNESVNATVEEVSQPIKIIPDSRKPVFYLNVDGKNYYRCAANSLIPQSMAGSNWRYSNSEQELSATLCKKSRDHNSILSLQSKLYDQGYLQSKTLSRAQLVDGVWGKTTLEAVQQYQQTNGLLYGNLTIETLEHIGVFSRDKQERDFQDVDMTKVEQPSVEQPVDMSDVATDVVIEESTVDVNEVGSPAVDPIAEANTDVNLPSFSLDDAAQIESFVEAAIAEAEGHNNTTPPNTSFDASPSNAMSEVADSAEEPGYGLNTEAPEEAEFVVKKIVPDSNVARFYQKIGGATYFRCADKAMTPIVDSTGAVMYSENRTELSATLCKKSRDLATITDLQYELYEKGFMSADGMRIGQLISGRWDARTLKAVEKYQRANGLLLGKLTIETLEHIGVFKPHSDRIVKASALNVTKPVDVELTASDTTVETVTTELQSGVDERQNSIEISDESLMSPEPKLADIDSVQNSRVAQIPFEPLEVRFATPRIQASDFIPEASKPEVYAYVGSYKLWRCKAGALMPEKDQIGNVVYGNVKEDRATLCKKSRTKKLMTRLQTALRDMGYMAPHPNTGEVEIDGVWGSNTLKAVKAYQKANGLPYGQLTIETMEHLGVIIEE